MEEIDTLRQQIADLEQVNRMLADGLATMGVAYVNQRVNTLADAVSSMASRIGTLESREAERDTRIEKASKAFRAMDSRVARLEFAKEKTT